MLYNPLFFGESTGGGGGGGGSGSVSPKVYGSLVAPIIITATGGIISTADPEATMFISSNSTFNVTANPQITPGVLLGQVLNLFWVPNAGFTIQLADGNGINIEGTITFRPKTVFQVTWNGVVWQESYRSQ